jgi:hypothetical protein
MLDNDSQLLIGLLSGLPTCAGCYLPATRKAILEWGTQIQGDKSSSSWLVCDHAAHESGVGGDAPTRFEPLEVAAYVNLAMTTIGLDGYLTYLINREMRRLQFTALAVTADRGLVAVKQGKRELFRASHTEVLTTLLEQQGRYKHLPFRDFVAGFQRHD